MWSTQNKCENKVLGNRGGEISQAKKYKQILLIKKKKILIHLTIVQKFANGNNQVGKTQSHEVLKLNQYFLPSSTSSNSEKLLSSNSTCKGKTELFGKKLNIHVLTSSFKIRKTAI